MAAARKSDVPKAQKKSIMPRLLIGVWLVALTVLLVIMFTNMPDQQADAPGKTLVKKITLPPPDMLQDLVKDKADKAEVKQLETRVDAVENKAQEMEAVAQKVEKQDGDIAVLDQRVDRLETTVSNKLKMPARSFSEIPTPLPESQSDTAPVTTPSSKPKETPAQTTANLPATQPKPLEKDTAGIQVKASDETPSAGPVEKTQPPTVAATQASASPAQAETQADRRAVRQKIAAREAYIRRTAPLRQSSGWSSASPEFETKAPQQITPPSDSGDVLPQIAASGPATEDSSGAGYYGDLSYGTGGPASSIHGFSRRFGHRVDFSDQVDGPVAKDQVDSGIARTAPGMTIFPDRTLDPMKID